MHLFLWSVKESHFAVDTMRVSSILRWFILGDHSFAVRSDKSEFWARTLLKTTFP